VHHDGFRVACPHTGATNDEGACHLGYPAYFSTLLGVGKIAGVCVLLAPGMVRLKEWAYVGFGITILSACYSHLSSGDGLMALEPLLTFAALVVSYKTRPASRRFLYRVLVKAAA
jgi:hypothetical protein